MNAEITPESLRQTAAAMEAQKAGKPIEYRRYDSFSGTWWNVSHPEWAIAMCEYRPKPEPVSRPWEPKDVPVNCWIRSKRNPDLLMFVNTIWHVGVAYSDAGRQPRSATFAQLFEDWEWSTDRKEWKACAIDAVTDPAQ